MRTFEEIYLGMQNKGENRFSLLELVKIFDNEVSWVGTGQQLLEIKSLNLEVTGIRSGECSACNLDALKNIARWVNQNEPNILKELENKKQVQQNFKHKHKR
jgi:hypothetical protein